MGIYAVGRDDTVGYDVDMTVEGSLGVSVSNFISGQVPDNEGLVSQGRRQKIRAGEGISEIALGETTAGETHFSKLVARQMTQPPWSSRESHHIFDYDISVSCLPFLSSNGRSPVLPCHTCVISSLLSCSCSRRKEFSVRSYSVRGVESRFGGAVSVEIGS